MLAPVELNDQHALPTHKVDDEVINRKLPDKFQVLEAAVADDVPEAAFGFRLIVPKSAGA